MSYREILKDSGGQSLFVLHLTPTLQRAILSFLIYFEILWAFEYQVELHCVYFLTVPLLPILYYQK